MQDAHAHPTPAATAQTSDFLLQTSKRSVTLRTGIGAAHDQLSTQSSRRRRSTIKDSRISIRTSGSSCTIVHQALSLDPRLALAHAGLAIAYTELNLPVAAKASVDRAQALAITDHDKRHIAARALQMAGQTAAYRAALDEALKAFPLDEELWLARGQAASDDPAERGQGSVAASIPFYEKPKRWRRNTSPRTTI